MVTLSLAMIVKNEAANIVDILRDAAQFCDELIVVDTGSTDNTAELAAGAGARVAHFEWVDDFAAARNAAFELCTSDWIVWLDADDRVPAQVQEAFRQIKSEVLTEDLDAVYLPYRYAYSPDGLHCTFELNRERLIRRRAGLRWQHRVHEIIALPDPLRVVHRHDAWIEHRPAPEEERPGHKERNLRILERAFAEGDRQFRTLFYLANELRDHRRFPEAIVRYEEFISTVPRGWERHNAMVSLATCFTAGGQEDEALAALHRAMQEDGRRADAFVAAGMVHYRAERWQQAVPYFLGATAMSQPSDGFINNSDYGWAPWDYLSICFHRTGRQQEALEALAKAVEGNPQPARLADNAKWFLEAASGQSLH